MAQHFATWVADYSRTFYTLCSTFTPTDIGSSIKDSLYSKRIGVLFLGSVNREKWTPF